MSIQRYEYELSVWKETLSEQGKRKEEKKMAIIGANDMGYAGRATKLKFTTKINGTHTLTFEMPDKFFDNEKGDFVHNELVDALFNECKLKFHYKKKWHEFYIKNVSDAKKFKSYIRTYTCSDVFIDELSRNGYGITFDEELYNNVEEIGTFTEEILEDSVWEYDAHLNWGDFTEYAEERLFKIPLSLFGGTLLAHKLNYQTNTTEKIQNIYTDDSRAAEMGDDLARELGQFWDSYSGENSLLSNSTVISNENYIYIPYSQLDFCYVSSDTQQDNGLEEAFVATEEPGLYKDKGYAIAPNSIDPNHLIQFIFIPEGEKVEIDEAGLIVNKDFTYVITVEEWNKQIQSELFYYFEDYKENGFKIKKLVEKGEAAAQDYSYGNWAAYYDGYLTEIGDLEVETGKKISISDRTEINISDEIDQYVTVYSNRSAEYKELYSNEEWNFNEVTDSNYRVCSKIDTRQIVPQLARNLVQNGTEINSVTGWEIMTSNVASQTLINAAISFGYTELEHYIEIPDEGYSINTGGVRESYLVFTPSYIRNGDSYTLQDTNGATENNAVVNFGIIGQEKQIDKEKTYALGINIRKLSDKSKEDIDTNILSIEGSLSNAFIRIGEGELISDGDYQFKDSLFIDFSLSRLFNGTDAGAARYILFKPNRTYQNPYIAIYSNATYELVQLTLFEAYTKGVDQFNSNEATFKYSGRDLFSNYTPNSGNGFYYSQPYTEESLRRLILFEDTVMPGDTFSYNRYFIQKLKTSTSSYDTFMAKEYLSEDGYEDQLPLNSGKYTTDDYDIITNYIDLNNCEHYNPAATATSCDCKYNSSTYDKVCLYQKYGYCPYRFQTEKHCRKIRTLTGEKSNRFNLTQELGKVFEIYPVYYTSHNQNNGKILNQQQAYELGLRQAVSSGRADWMDKRIFYITEKGKENKIGFRYEKNLSNISRAVNSDKIVTKLYVLDADSEISKTGMCSIKTAEDNPSKDSFIIDFSYYMTQGILDKERTLADLYGIDDKDLGYLKTLGYYNTQYDKISNLIINLSAASFTELQANLEVNLTGIETAQKKLRNLEKKMSRYTVKDNNDYLTNSTYLSYKNEYIEQYAIYVQLIEDTFYTNGQCVYGSKDLYPPSNFLNNMSIDEIKKQWVDTHNYKYGILGQFNKEYNQINEWTKEQAQYLRKINKLSLDFYQKYEPYLKEGTWSDNNYLTDNAYYLDAIQVAKEGAIPSVSYSITVSDIEPLYLEGDYDFEVADSTYIEDIGMFGINPRTGLPNRLKVLVSELNEEPDEPSNNKINVQDFTTQFEDLFQQVSATVQSLTFNEKIYKRASNFTSQQNVKKESLQGTLDENNLELVNTQEQNIQINWNGQSGSDINNHNNKYKLNGQGLFFSNNGGESWNTAITPNGINADYLKVGTIDTSKVRLVDGSYIYFTWDRDGIKAYRDPKTVSGDKAFKDYAQFNKYGLSLVEDGNIRLRAGYAFSSTDGSGAANKEQDIAGDSPLGFYLYNSDGRAIFATESSKSNNQALETARINLIGEILASNDATITNFYGYQYGGTCYNTRIQSFYSLGNENDILAEVTVTPIDGVVSYRYPSTAAATIADYAALIAFQYENANLQKIIIIEGVGEDEITYEYENPSITTGATDQNGYFSTTTNGQKFVIFNRYVATFTNQPQKDFIILKGTNNIIFKGARPLMQTNFLTYTVSQSTENSERLLSQSTLTAVNLSNQIVNGSIPYYYYRISTVNNLYKISDNYYSTYLNESTQTSDGAVALYINNRNDLTNKASDSSRLFVCCKGDETKVGNIFSILKDGSLHMGGTIQGQVSATELSDQINITDEYLIIQPDGKLKMSFDDIVNINSNESIVTYIADQLNNATASIVEQVDELLDRRHAHYIPPAAVGWERPESISTIYGDIPLTDITINIHFIADGTPIDTDISLKDLLDRINYYGDLTYGYIYTEETSI